MSINQVFAELSARLSDIENYQIARTEGYSFGEYYELMRGIQHQIDLYPFADTISMLKYYIGRTNSSIERIVEKYPIEAKDIKRPISTNFVDEKTTKSIPQEIYILEELEYYRERLSFLAKMKENVQSSPGDDTKVEIQLPESFSIKNLQIHFLPKLSSDQIALFLDYLKAKEIIPNYKNSHLIKLAEPLFARSGQDIREALGNVHSSSIKNKSNLNALRNLLTGLLEEVEKDMKSFK